MARKREQSEDRFEEMSNQLRLLAETEENLLDSVHVRRTLAKLILYQLAENPTDGSLMRLLVSLLETRHVRGPKSGDRNAPGQSYAELLKEARAATA